MDSKGNIRKIDNYNHFYHRLNRNMMIVYLMMAVVFWLLFFFSGSPIYTVLFLGFGILGMVLSTKYLFFYIRPKTYLIDEINDKCTDMKSRLKILSLLLICTVALCVIFLFLTSHRDYFSLIIPITMMIAIEYIVIGVNYFQLSILQEELSRG